MSLTSRQIALVEESFARIAPISPLAADLFYSRLFAIAPDVQPMFEGDMERQGEKLMSTIALVVGSLRRLDAVMPELRALGASHATFGVQPEHYGLVREALLFTLESGLGDAFTAECREAWSAIYDFISTEMTAAAHPAAEFAAE